VHLVGFTVEINKRSPNLICFWTSFWMLFWPITLFPIFSTDLLLCKSSKISRRITWASHLCRLESLPIPMWEAHISIPVVIHFRRFICLCVPATQHSCVLNCNDYSSTVAIFGMPGKKKNLSFSYIFAWTSVSPHLSRTKAHHLALSHTYCWRDVTMVTANKDEQFLTDHWFSFFVATVRLLINYIRLHNDLPHAKFSYIKHLF